MTRPSRRWLVIVAASLLVPLAVEARFARGQAPSVGGPIPSDPNFVALRVDGTTATGQVRQLSPGSGLVLVPGPDAADQAIPLDHLVKLNRVAPPPAAERESRQVLFPDRDHLAARAIGSIGATSSLLEVESASLGNLAIPTDRLLGLIFALPASPEQSESLLAQVRSDPRTTESLWISNGDRVNGGLLGLDGDKVAFQGAAGKASFDRAGVVALGFDPALTIYPRPDSLFLELGLLDGTRIGVADPRVEQGHLLGSARFGAPVRVPLSELLSVHVLGGPVQYLSDREATGTQYEAYVGPTRPYRRDLNVTGRPIRLGGQTFERGLGTQSRTLLAYRLEPTAQRFQATVGVDDSAGPLGSVAFKVLVDGMDKVRFASPTMTSHEPPRTIDVDVAGGRLLILITEFGDRGNVQDLADWAEARVIRTTPSSPPVGRPNP